MQRWLYSSLARTAVVDEEDTGMAVLVSNYSTGERTVPVELTGA